MLYKKTIVIWGREESAVQQAGRAAIQCARQHDEVVAFGCQPELIRNPEQDPDFDEIVEPLVAGANPIPQATHARPPMGDEAQRLVIGPSLRKGD